MSIDGQLAEKVKTLLQAEREKAQANVMDENGRTIAKDFSEVRFSGGYIRGLRDAITIIDQTMAEIMKGSDT